MPHPRLAFHEGQVLLQVGAAGRGEQAGQVGRVEDDLRDAQPVGGGGAVQLVQVFGQRGEVDVVLAPAGIGIELDVVAKLVADPVGSGTDAPAALRTGTKKSTEVPFWCERCGRRRPPEGQPVSP